MFGIRPIEANSKPTTHSISIKDIKFLPEDLQIDAGDTVVWTNEDIVPHTVTDKGIFDSKPLQTNAQYKRQFKKKGDFIYTCTLHPMMTAKIKVK